MPNDPAKPKPTKRQLWNKLGRFITGIVVLCFFLPFFGVSCDGMDVITVSGADMVGGCRPGGMITEMADQAEKKHPGIEGAGEGKLDAKIDKVDREPLAIAALVLAIVAFGLAWVRSRGALVGSFVVAIAGLGALVGLYIKVSSQMHDEIDEENKKSSKSGMAKDVHVESGGRMGLWLTAAGLIAIAGLSGLALREKETPDPPV